MMKSIILSLGLTLFISLGVPPQCQAEPINKTWSRSSKEVVRAAPPEMKITTQGGGKFLLEPLTAPPGSSKTFFGVPLSCPPRSGPEVPASKPRLRPTSQNVIEPQGFIQMVIAKVRHARYVWGASLETGPTTDCSGFTQFIYRICKINLPRTSTEQAQVGQVVTRRMDFSKLQAGDLLFFRDRGRVVGHVGLYLGEGKMIHAANRRLGVTVSELDQEYYVNNFVVAKRVIEKKYKWPTFPGLSAADRNRDFSVGGPGPLPGPWPAPLPKPLPKLLLKLFWPWRLQPPIGALSFG